MHPEQPVLEKLNAVLDAHSVEDLWALLLDLMAGHGFDRLFFAATRFGQGDHWGEKSDWLMLTNHQPELVRSFIGDDLFRHTAIVHAPPGGQPGPYSWALRPHRSRSDMSDAERRHRKMCEKHDVTSGYTLWFPETNARSKSVLGMCARPGLSQQEVDQVWKEHGDVLWALANVIQMKLVSLPNPGFDRRLTSRQKEVLDWVADGKTGRDIAKLMSISPVTVEKHLRQARDALNAETTAQAVKKAALLNHLHLVPTGNGHG